MANTTRRYQYHSYTKEILGVYVAKSYSVAQVMRLLGFHYVGGGAQTYIAKRIKFFGIDSSHFTGQGHNRGKPSNRRLDPHQIFVVNRNSGRREQREKLHRTLQTVGVKYMCRVCGCPPVWRNMKLTLHIDHANGDPLDCRRNNLRYLCPNCHSQTATFGTKNRLTI